MAEQEQSKREKLQKREKSRQALEDRLRQWKARKEEKRQAEPSTCLSATAESNRTFSAPTANLDSGYSEMLHSKSHFMKLYGI